MEKVLKDYKNFVSQFEMVGSNVVYLSNDGYLENECSGFSSLEKNTETNTNAIYRIASISKVIVAIGVLKLYEKGLVILSSGNFGFLIKNPK